MDEEVQMVNIDRDGEGESGSLRVMMRIICMIMIKRTNVKKKKKEA